MIPLTTRGALLAIYGLPPKCNYCNKVGVPKPGFKDLNPNWKGNHWGGLTVDHIVPKCLGGRSMLENYQILCTECNQQKSVIEQRVLEQWVQRK